MDRIPAVLSRFLKKVEGSSIQVKKTSQGLQRAGIVDREGHVLSFPSKNCFKAVKLTESEGNTEADAIFELSKLIRTETRGKEIRPTKINFMV